MKDIHPDDVKHLIKGVPDNVSYQMHSEDRIEAVHYLLEREAWKVLAIVLIICFIAMFI